MNSYLPPTDDMFFILQQVLKAPELLQALPAFPDGAEAHFLAADLQARGLLEAARRRYLKVLDDAAFCDLLAAHGHCLTWT